MANVNEAFIEQHVKRQVVLPNVKSCEIVCKFFRFGIFEFQIFFLRAKGTCTLNTIFLNYGRQIDKRERNGMENS